MNQEQKIKELEERIRQLEQRPIYPPPQYHVSQPILTPLVQWPRCTCGKQEPHMCSINNTGS